MRIVHVITRLIIGGAQENTLLTAQGLQRDYRDDVTLITGPAEGPEGDLFDRASKSGLKLELFPELVRAVRPGTDLKAYLKLRKRIRDLAPEVVHTHSSKAGVLGRAAAWAEGVPFVVHTIHGLPFGPSESPMNNKLYVGLERWSARRCHQIVSVCDAMTEQALAAGVGRAEQYTTIYSGMDVDAFLSPKRARGEVRAELGLEEDDVAFGTVARLFERKGHEDVIAAAPAVLARRPNVKFVFIGNGVWREKLEQMIAKAAMTHAFRFTGLVDPSRIPELLGARRRGASKPERGLGEGSAAGAHRRQARHQLRRRWSSRGRSARHRVFASNQVDRSADPSDQRACGRPRASVPHGRRGPSGLPTSSAPRP